MRICIHLCEVTPYTLQLCAMYDKTERGIEVLVCERERDAAINYGVAASVGHVLHHYMHYYCCCKYTHKSFC